MVGGSHGGGTVAATRWGIVLMVVGAGVVAAFQVGKAPAAIPLLRSELGMSLFASGWVISLINVIGMVGGMAAGAVVDWFGHRRTTLAGLALIAFANLLGALAPGVWTILLSRFIEGLGFLVVTVAIPVLIVQTTAARDVKLAFGVWGAYMPVGIAVIVLISPLIIAPLGWRGLWWFNALLAAFYTLALAAATRMIARRPKTQPLGPPKPWRDIRRVLATPGPPALGLCFMAYSANWIAVLGFLPTFLVEELKLPVSTAAILTALVSTANAAGNLSGGWLLHCGAARWRLLAFAHLAMVLTGFVIYTDAVPHWGRYLACLLFSGLSGILPPSVLSGVPSHAPSPALVGTCNGLVVQASNLGQMLGPPILAALVGFVGGWQASPAFVASISLLGIGFALWIRRLEREIAVR